VSRPGEEGAPVVIVGAGLAGLSCARILAQAGVSVTVLEASDGVGGRIRTDVVEGFRLDRGFRLFLTAYSEARALLDYAALDLHPFEPGALVWVDGRFFTVMDPTRRPVRPSPRLFVCGDHVENASINGAMAAGRRAAEAILLAGAGVLR